MEQHAIELVSNIGNEHIFVAHCPSEINVDMHSVKVITFEEAFEYCDTSFGLRLLLPRAYTFRKLVDLLVERDVSVHFVFTCPMSVNETEAAAWL